LDEIDGVESSFVNRSGTLIRLSLAVAADREKIVAEAARVLSDGDEDRLPISLDVAAATAALQAEEWRDASQVTELSAIEMRTMILRGLLAVGLIVALIGFAIFWRRRKAQRQSALIP
jgi:hypothetical protein